MGESKVFTAVSLSFPRSCEEMNQRCYRPFRDSAMLESKAQQQTAFTRPRSEVRTCFEERTGMHSSGNPAYVHAARERESETERELYLEYGEREQCLPTL